MADAVPTFVGLIATSKVKKKVCWCIYTYLIIINGARDVSILNDWHIYIPGNKQK